MIKAYANGGSGLNRQGQAMQNLIDNTPTIRGFGRS